MQNEDVLARLHRSRVRRPGRHRLQPRHRGASGKDDGEGREEEGRRDRPEGVLRARSATSSRCASSWGGGSPATAAGARRSSSPARATAVPRRPARAHAAGDGGHRAQRRDPDLARARDLVADARPTTTSSAGSTSLPTMAAAAAHHGRSRAFAAGTRARRGLREAETFATGDYASFLTRGASMAPAERERILARLADLIGLPVELVTRAEGRITIRHVLARAAPRRAQGARPLRRDDHRHRSVPRSGLVRRSGSDARRHRPRVHDGDQPAAPVGDRRRDRSRVHAAELRGEQSVDATTPTQHFFAPPTGATDDFRYGMSLNPHMKAFITHGRYDLVTPYYASDRLRNLMRLDPETADRLTVRHFGGGHMFYAWETSRRDVHRRRSPRSSPRLPRGTRGSPRGPLLRRSWRVQGVRFAGSGVPAARVRRAAPLRAFLAVASCRAAGGGLRPSPSASVRLRLTRLRAALASGSCGFELRAIKAGG